MTIIRAGVVQIRDEGVLISGFDFEAVSLTDGAREALTWAREKVDAAIAAADGAQSIQVGIPGELVSLEQAVVLDQADA